MENHSESAELSKNAAVFNSVSSRDRAAYGLVGLVEAYLFIWQQNGIQPGHIDQLRKAVAEFHRGDVEFRRAEGEL